MTRYLAFEWWCNPRGRVDHLFVHGAATGDMALCGRVGLGSDATKATGDVACSACRPIAARASDPLAVADMLADALQRYADRDWGLDSNGPLTFAWQALDAYGYLKSRQP